jgi:hypothetical protein
MMEGVFLGPLWQLRSELESGSWQLHPNSMRTRYDRVRRSKLSEASLSAERNGVEVERMRLNACLRKLLVVWVGNLIWE